MTTIKQWVQKAALALEKCTPEGSLSSCIREARLLISHVLACEYERVFFNDHNTLTRDEEKQADFFLSRRLAHEPLSKIRQYKEFWGHSFKVSKHTLDPRPDTETLVEAILGLRSCRKEPLSILEIGTGTGCIIISLLLEYPHALGTGVDISMCALDVAKENRALHNLDNRLILKESEWFSALTGVFDIIVSNPPYIDKNDWLPPSVYKYDPHIALFAENKGLASYEEIAKNSSNFLKENGFLVLEIGHNQEQDVVSIFEKAHFSLCLVKADLNNIARCLVFCKKTLEKENKN